MSWSFNPFTGNLDIVGGGAVVFEGEVETFAELPETVGDPAVGASYLVRISTGVWLVNKRQSGIWIRRNNTGVRATDWEYGGDYPVNSVNGQTGNVSLTASSVGAAAATHASTHHTGGTDAIAPNNIGAAWSLVASSQFITGNTLLSAGRNRRITLAVVATANVDLPYNDNVNGDVLTLVQSATGGLTATIRMGVALVGGVPSSYVTLATLTTVGQSFTFVSDGTASGWSLRGVETHTHAASQITDFAQAAQDYTVVSTAQTLTVGAKVAANTTAGAFTLTLPATPSDGDTVAILDYAGTFDTNNLTIARNGSNIESLAENMDCNIEDAAFSLVFVGSTVGWKVVPYFGSVTDLTGYATTAQLSDTQIFTANGTWTKPAGAKMVHYIVIGGGGGGGSGRCDNAGTDRSGGGGGCAGGISVGWLDASAFGATETITVGAGGAGGGARNTVANGQIGTSGGVSSIGSVIQTFASAAGGGGLTTSGGGGTGASNSARIYSADGTTNGGVNGSSGSRAQGSAIFNAPTGGQGGSGISAANVVSASAAAADSGHVRTGAFVAGGTGGASAAGGNGNSGGMNFVGTGGGGGSPNSSTGAGNAGGNGGLYGGGGGGGSAGAFPAASGAGGNGADGIVVITTYR